MSKPLSLVFELARTESSPVLLTVRSGAAFRAAVIVALAASRLAVADDQQPSPASSSTPASSFDDNNAVTATAGEVIVDGARQTGRTDGYLDLDRFGIADIEQIEIMRGPSSALYRGVDASATGAVFDRRNLVETAKAQASRPVHRRRHGQIYNIYCSLKSRSSISFFKPQIGNDTEKP